MKRSIPGVALVLAAALAVPAPGIASDAPGTAPPKSAAPDGDKNLTWENVNLPFGARIPVPAGTTLVRATASGGADESFFVSMRNALTERARCHTPTVRSWDLAITGQGSCVALAAIDPPKSVWTVNVTGSASTAARVEVEFVDAPPSGPAGRLNLSRLSMPTYKIGATEEVIIDSFDGTRLHAQLTRPVTNAKVPTVIVSSPYEYGDGIYEQDLVRDWGPRGYAILVADVRGYNRSGGCVEVWGPNEQKDQKVLVEWVAKQPWSDGNVGMYGASYVGTTPVEAAVQAPKALKAIVVTAPVINAYDDWHFGGVPNGESVLSPISYQVLTGSFPDESMLTDPMLALQHATGGICDPTLVVRANDYRAIYDSFYEERNFGKRAKNVDAAVLYTHGYEDYNVKDVVGAPFFNDLDAPRLGLFGHWIHAYPPRADTQVLFLAWMDQYLKGKPIALERLPNALVMNDQGEQRELAQWPTPTTRPHTLELDFTEAALVDEAREDSEGQIIAEPAGLRQVSEDGTLLRLARRVQEPLELAGAAAVDLAVTLRGGDNAYIGAHLYDQTADERSLITFGMANLAHRNGHDTYKPVPPGEVVEMRLPFLITDHVFERGHDIVLEIYTVDAVETAGAPPGQPGVVTVKGGPKATKLVLPTLPADSARAAGRFVDWML